MLQVDNSHNMIQNNEPHCQGKILWILEQAERQESIYEQPQVLVFELRQLHLP